MKISILAGVAALSAAVSAAPAAAPAPVPEAASAGALPACGYLVRPCQCPSGTQFATSTTYALIGGDAKNVQAISGDCTFLKQPLIRSCVASNLTLVAFFAQITRRSGSSFPF